MAQHSFGFLPWVKDLPNSPIALLVVLTLVVMSVLTLAYSFERWWVFRKMRAASIDFTNEVNPVLQRKDIKGTLALTQRFSRSHLAKVLNAGLHEWVNHEEQKEEFDLIDAIERSLERSTALTTAELRRGLGLLATVASSAPFVGLVGTVGGIIRTFQILAREGGGDLAKVSGGIAEALYTTLLGLAVAIPAVWLYNYFTNQIEYFQVEMTNSASEMVGFFMKLLGQQSSSGNTAAKAR